MGSRRRYHVRYPQSDTEYLRKRADRHPITVPVSEHGVVKMQHVIGNQAVQRLLQRQMQLDKTAVVQRAPDGERPGALATLVLAKKGKLRGGSRIAGHEGKLELLSISLGSVQKPTSRESESEDQRIEITLTKYADDTSTLLMEAMLKGEGVKSAQFEFIHFDDEGKAEVFHTLEHSDGMITGFQMAGSGSGGKATETVTIEFRVKPKK
jgi:type VI protein secretion system component Hcp